MITHYPKSDYPSHLASKTEWSRRGRKVLPGEIAVATADRQKPGFAETEQHFRNNRRYKLFDLYQTEAATPVSCEDSFYWLT